MLRTTYPRHFFKSHSHLPHSNPLRRWVHVKFAAIFLGGIIAAPFISYSLCGINSSKQPPDCFAGYTMQLYMEMAPLNLMSRAIGDLASAEVIPQALHAKAIRTLAWVYSINLDEFPPVESYRTTQDFFCRKFKHGGSRPLEIEAAKFAEETQGHELLINDTTQQRKTQLFSPCDAEILQCGEVAADRTMLQVKGFSYPVDGLFRMTLPPIADPETQTRQFFVFHLRPGDYHRVHSPRNMTVQKTLHVPGLLLPTTHTAMRWLPNLILSNERVLLFGEQAQNIPHSAGTDEPRHNKAVTAMALVGATCVGRICVSFDERIVSNVADAPETSVVREYGRAAPTIKSGEEVGHFKWGSCVVLIADVPKASLPLAVKPGSEVRQGQRLC